MYLDNLKDINEIIHYLIENYKSPLISKVVNNSTTVYSGYKGFGVELEVIDVELNKTFEEELVSDIVSLMASFSARLYGKRGSKNKNENNKK